MFGSLTQKFQDLFSRLSKNKTVTEENLADAVKEVRLALLEADVNYQVASQIVRRVKEKTVGQQRLRSVELSAQFAKVVHEELIRVMGSKEPEIKLQSGLTTILLCGLQGTGKTTQSIKLANYLRKSPWNRKALVVAADLQRPAAMDQLQQLGAQAGMDVYVNRQATSSIQVAQEALQVAREQGYGVLIVDTAGRLHVDSALMEELQGIKEAIHPDEILFVASANMGQDAVKTALEFDRHLEITGSILTMLDGSARAGAALSIREVTQKPLKFEGVGEKVEDFRLFYPESMADRILGMGDMINLAKKAEEHVNEAAAKELEQKLRKAAFTYEDYLQQMGMVRKMGSLKGLLGMIPGFSGLGELDFSEKEFQRLEAIIFSMTPKERKEQVELTPSRRTRIAKGSGTGIDEVNRLVKGFKKAKQLMKQYAPMMKGDMNPLFNKERSLWR